jgi:hypothetical protein
VNTNEHPNGGRDDDRVNDRGRPAQLTVLAAIVGLEFLLVAAAAVFLIVELVIDVPLSYGSAISLLVLALIAAVWLAVLAVQTLRAAPWVRAGIIVWQLLQIAVAVGLFQGGEFARPDLAWPLLIPSLAALLLVFSRPVTAATRRE